MHVLVNLLRIAGALNLAGSVLGAVWYWDVFEGTVDQVSNFWVIAGTLGILAGGSFSFLVFMALAEILEACHENRERIDLIANRP
ncbi:MAG: hypothetical protein V3T08_09630 [Gemmatimonadota bacterium]